MNTLPPQPAGRVICSICGKTRLYPGLQCQRVNFDSRDREGKFVRAGSFVCWFHTLHEIQPAGSVFSGYKIGGGFAGVYTAGDPPLMADVRMDWPQPRQAEFVSDKAD